MNIEEQKYKEIFDDLKQYESEDTYLDEFNSLLYRVLYNKTRFVDNSENDSKRLEVFNLIKEEIKKIYAKYKTQSKFFEFIGCGHTSLSFKIGDYVLKIGKTEYGKSTNNYSNFTCLVPQYINKYYEVANKEHYTLQLTTFVDTKGITEEELYSAYKSLRDLGYIWNDPTPENIGRIISDQVFNNNIYTKGDIVIIDLEDIAYVGEITSDTVLEEISMMSYNRRTYQYEVRYMEEKGIKL